MATLIEAGLTQFAPTTNHYRLDTGHHILITRADDTQPVPDGLVQFVAGIRVDEVIAPDVEIFLCDENAQPIDADGDPTNGLTPLLRLAPDTSFDDACAAADGELSDVRYRPSTN